MISRNFYISNFHIFRSTKLTTNDFKELEIWHILHDFKMLAYSLGKHYQIGVQC